MTSYLVYSTVALKWNRKIQCGNSCRRISFSERRSHTFFSAVHPCLLATIFGQKFSSARNQILFSDQYSVASNHFFSTYYTVFLKLRYRNIVAENLVIWLTAHFRLTFPAVTWKILFDHFQCPCDAMDTFQGKVPTVFFGGEAVLVFEIIYLFFDLQVIFYGQMISI